MTGWGNEFYFAIGYEPIVKWSVWEKLGKQVNEYTLILV
jgi:hypothetical protein